MFRELNSLRFLLSRRDKIGLIGLLILMVIGSILEAIGIGAVPAFISSIMRPATLSELPYVGGWFNDLPEEPTASFALGVGLAFSAFMLLKNLFLWVVINKQAGIVARLRLKLGDKVYQAYQHAPYEWHLQRNSSELIRNLQNDVAQILNGYVMPFLTLVMSVAMSAFVIAVMAVNATLPLLMSLLVIGGGLFLVMRTMQKRMRAIGLANRSSIEAMFKSIQQGFGGLLESKVLGIESFLSDQHREALATQAQAQKRVTTIQKSTPLIIETIAIAGMATIVVLIVASGDSFVAALPLVALLGVATMRLKQLASQIAGSINQMNTAKVCIPEIVDDLRSLQRMEDERRGRLRTEVEIGHFEELTLKDLCYTYPGASDQAISSISLTLKKGESIAFVGPTGGGKSTLVNLILGLLQPQSGEILVNSVATEQVAHQWRELLGYIPQSIFLVDDTVSANVAFGVGHALIDREKVLNALEAARLREFVESLPEGLETRVGERGIRLSGGQRQRLGIARALYFDPEILVMDEASSALDSETESEVMSAINSAKGNRTLLMIAHRLSTLSECDRIYKIEKGCLVEAGGELEASLGLGRVDTDGARPR